MVSVDFNPKELIDEDGYANFRGIAAEMRKDWDYPGLIVGPERVGKSTFAMICTAIVDPTLCIGRVVFPTAELQYAILKAKNYQGIIQDEGAETWLSVDSNSRQGREIKRLFMMMGYKDLFMAILLPDVRLVEKYLKTHRAKFIIRIRRRGMYEYYSAHRIPEIRVDAVTKMVKWPIPTSVGWFKDIPKGSAFWKAYLEKKAAHISNKADVNPKVIEERLKMERLKRNTVDMRTAGQILGVTHITVERWLTKKRYKKLHIKPLMIGNAYRLSLGDVRKIRKYRLGDIDSYLKEEEEV